MNQVINFLFCLFILATLNLEAQNYAQFSGYMYNKLHLNPAYAGANGQLDMNVFYRDQWSGIEGAPTTIDINAHTAFRERTGVGISLINDNLGHFNQTSAVLTYAYKLPVSNTSQLAIGVSGRMVFQNMDFNLLNRTHDDDLNIPINNQSSSHVNFGTGLMWYSDDHYIGISAPNLLNTNFESELINQDNSPLFFMAGKIFQVSRNVKIHPSTLVGYFSSGMKVEVGSQVIFKDRIFLGANYRVNISLGGIAKYQINNSLALGAIYERNTGRIGQFTGNTFEVFAEYSISRNVSKNTNIRYF